MRIYNIISIPKGLQEVECNCQEEYFSGYTAGYEDGKNKGFQSGYTSGVTDGIEEGKEEQKSLMVYTAITENGTYSREDGYNEIFVDVPSYSGASYESGYTDGYASGYTDGSEDGFESGYTSGYTDGTEDGFGSGFTSGYTQGYSSGYTDGLNTSGQSYESGYTSGYTDGYESGYTQGTEDGFGSGYTDGYGSGYTDGSEDGYGSGYTSGKTDGVAEQKAKLVSTAVTSNGSYSREDGFSSISVNVPQTGHTDEEIEEAFSSGKTAGVDEQKAKLVATAFTANGTFSRPDGFSSVYVNVPQTGQTINNQTKNVNISQNGSSTVTHDSNYTGLEYVTINVNVPTQDYWNMGFASGYTIGTADGVDEQKAKLTSTAFTQNGTYTRADGWSAVTVNVSGYTQQDLDNAFRSGWTNGYNSGYTDGQADCGGYASQYLTIKALSAGTLYWYTNSTSFTRTIEWSNDDGQNWNSVTSSNANSGSVITTVQPGDEILLKGDNDWYCGKAANLTGTTSFKTDFAFDVYGNINSLINSTAFTEVYDFSSGHTFCYLFSDCSGLRSAEHLIMQTTGLTEECYDSMFYGCASLTTAPELPATTLANSCYLWMFSNCTSLTTAPALPATTLAQSCYSSMFNGCTSLTAAPELPATTLASTCYSGMFLRCTSLVTPPALPATTLAQGCYRSMFNSCTSLTTAPELLATTLVSECYSGMFNGCTSLSYIKCLATNTSLYGYTDNWVASVASSGTFVKSGNATWSTGNNGIPYNWTVQDAQ